MLGAMDDGGGTVLHEGYRRRNDGEIPDEVTYFYSDLLSRIDPKRIAFDKSKMEGLLSDMSTVPDEAFGLLALHNELGAWGKQYGVMQQGKKNRELRVDKEYTSHNGGAGWGLGGLLMYGVLGVQTKGRRGGGGSKGMERQIRNDYKGENPERIGNTDAATPRLKHMISFLDKNQGELNNKEWSNYAQH